VSTSEATPRGASPALAGTPLAANELRARVARFLVAEGPLVVVCATFLVLWARLAAYATQADTWLTLLGGR